MKWIDKYAIVAGQVGWVILQVVVVAFAIVGVSSCVGGWQ